MGSNLVNPKTAINVVKAIGLAKTLQLPRVDTSGGKLSKLVDILPPKNLVPNETVKVRVISHEIRKGMVRVAT